MAEDIIRSLPKFDLQAILSDPPKLHDDGKGQLISDFRIDDRTCFELNRRLKAGLSTLETGAGLSTIIFAARVANILALHPSKRKSIEFKIIADLRT